MTPEHARELLGGLASGILTPEERQTLFEAALHDQALFNEVADELEFAAFLQSPETRAQLANRIEVEPERRPWWALRPGWLALTGVLAASTVLFVAVWHRPGEVAQPSAPVLQVATESAKKEVAPAPAASPRKVTAARAIPRATAENKKPAAVVETAKSSPVKDLDRSVKNRPEPRNQQLSAQGAAPAIRGARLMAPQAAESADAVRAVPPAAPPATSLTGTVHDASGAPISGATVDIVDNSTNSTTHVATDANGRFVALSLPASGPYTLIATAPGFKKEQRSVTLDGNQPAQVEIPLQVGATSEIVEVTAAAAALPSSQLSQNLTQIAVLDFANGSGQQSGAQVADLLSSQLLSGGQVRVIDREKVQQAVQSQTAQSHTPGGRQQSTQEAAALGRSIGADAVIVGSVQASVAGGAGLAKRNAVTGVLLTAQVIDAKQAQQMMQAAADGASLQGATKDLGNQLQSKLAKPAEGSVTNLTGDIVSVKFADPPGLPIRAHCDVIRGTRKIGELIITSVNGQFAVGKFSGTGQPRVGDRVTASR